MSIDKFKILKTTMTDNHINWLQHVNEYAHFKLDTEDNSCWEDLGHAFNEFLNWKLS